jgi:hypothetical protein
MEYNDCFLLSETPLVTGHALYSKAIECLKSFVDSRECGKKFEKACTKKFHTCLEQSISNMCGNPEQLCKKEFLQQYQTLEKLTRLNQSINKVQEEAEITGNEPVGESLHLKCQKRKV